VTEVSLHELTRTRDCKVDGCPWDAVDARGRYAGLCRDRVPLVVAASPNGAIVTAAREVLDASRELERSLAGLHEAELRRATATEVWRDRMAGLLAVTKRYLEA